MGKRSSTKISTLVDQTETISLRSLKGKQLSTTHHGFAGIL